MPSRAANTATVEQAAKALRGCCTSLCSGYQETDCGKTCSSYEGFLLDLSQREGEHSDGIDQSWVQLEQDFGTRYTQVTGITSR